MHDNRYIFVSYSRTDIAIMQRVKGSLHQAGLAVWTDEGIEPGTTLWQDSIADAIEHAGCVVILLSPDAKNSVWVKRELNYATTHNKRIFALLVRGDESTSVPFALIGSQYVDIRVDYDAGIIRLAQVVAELFDTNVDTESEAVFVLTPRLDPLPIEGCATNATRTYTYTRRSAGLLTSD